MSINQLDSKKQYLILIVMVVVLFGLYVSVRLMPAMDGVATLNKQLKKDEKLLKKPNIPQEPLEDIEELEDQVAALEIELEQLVSQSSTLAKKMPELESQDVMLKISDAARSSRVRIVNNVPYLAKKRINYTQAKSGKKLSRSEQKKHDKRMRKAIKKARKAARRGQTIGTYTRKGELMDKLVNDFEISRPLHSLKVEGTYQNIKSFIEALQGLPWQITVVKIDYKLLGRDTAQGYPQPLIVNMIIGA